MISIGLLIGAYSYTIFLLGVAGLLNRTILLASIIIYGIVGCFILIQKIKKNFFTLSLKRIDALLLMLIISQAAVNIVGVLAPELSFDALWYHLTLPKIYLLNYQIFFIPGGLYYYSVMPKLIEMLYIPALLFGNEITVKIIHFSFGILTLLVLYSLSRRFLDKTYSLLALVVFYSSLVVGWESITAYIDLGRTFYEILALFFFIKWWEKRSLSKLLFLGALVGLAISSKLIAIGSLGIFIILILLTSQQKIKDSIILLLLSLFIPLPWFIFSYLNTGNPVYPLFSPLYTIMPSLQLLNPFNFFFDMVRLFTFADDPISPLYIIFLPFLGIVYKKFTKKEKLLVTYSLLALVVWYITPRTGGGRFILPYLPAFSLVLVITAQYLNKKVIKSYIMGVIIIASIISISYRALANAKYIPVIMGRESKDEFLEKNLNFSFGDFYDKNQEIKKIVKNNTVLIIGGHNLYYVGFKFVHESYVRLKDSYSYILTIDEKLPNKYKGWKLIYYNEVTKAKLYNK